MKKIIFILSLMIFCSCSNNEKNKPDNLMTEDQMVNFLFGFNTFCESAFNGNLENMKWLYANGCPFDDNTFNSAARNGNLDNMKWLFDNGFPQY